MAEQGETNRNGGSRIDCFHLDRNIRARRLVDLHAHLLGMGDATFWIDIIMREYLVRKYERDEPQEPLSTVQSQPSSIESGKSEPPPKKKQKVTRKPTERNLSQPCKNRLKSVRDQLKFPTLTQADFFKLDSMAQFDVEELEERFTHDAVYSLKQLYLAFGGDLKTAVEDECNTTKRKMQNEVNIKTNGILDSHFSKYIVFNARKRQLKRVYGVKNSDMARLLKRSREARAREVGIVVSDTKSPSSAAMLREQLTEAFTMSRRDPVFTPTFFPRRFILKDAMYEARLGVLSLLVNHIGLKYDRNGVSYAELSLGINDCLNPDVWYYIITKSYNTELDPANSSSQKCRRRHKNSLQSPARQTEDTSKIRDEIVVESSTQTFATTLGVAEPSPGVQMQMPLERLHAAIQPGVAPTEATLSQSVNAIESAPQYDVTMPYNEDWNDTEFDLYRDEAPRSSQTHFFGYKFDPKNIEKNYLESKPKNLNFGVLAGFGRAPERDGGKWDDWDAERDMQELLNELQSNRGTTVDGMRELARRQISSDDKIQMRFGAGLIAKLQELCMYANCERPPKRPRESNAREVREKALAYYIQNFLVGLDAFGDEYARPFTPLNHTLAVDIVHAMIRQGALNFGIRLHALERVPHEDADNWDLKIMHIVATHECLKDLLEKLPPREPQPNQPEGVAPYSRLRLGHGTYMKCENTGHDNLNQELEAMRTLVSDKRVVIEVCATSNHCLVSDTGDGSRSSHVEGMLKLLLEQCEVQRIPFVLATDDDGIIPIAPCLEHHRHESVAHQYCTAISSELTRDIFENDPELVDNLVVSAQLAAFQSFKQFRADWIPAR